MRLVNKVIFGVAVPIVGLVGWSFGITSVFGIPPGLVIDPTHFEFESGPDPIAVRHPATEPARTTPVAQRTTPPPPLPCSLPRPAAGDQLVVFGAYAGAGLSTVALAGPDKETTAARVVIEPGKDPIFLVLSTYEPVVWSIEGASDRIKRVVLVTRYAAPQKRSAAGVASVSGDIVTFVRPGDCFDYIIDASGPVGDLLVDTFKRVLGRAPDTLASTEYTIGVSLPSGVQAAPAAHATEIPPSFDGGEWHAFLRASPGGLVPLAPHDVVSAVNNAAYDLPPQEAGLAQLIGSGAVVKADDSFNIVKPVARFPAGLTGSHAVRFVLASRISTPKGDPGDSCVVSASGSILVSGSGCAH